MTVTDAAIAGIKEMIVSGHLGPGERLPRESDLAARLGLSRSSLREAVRALTLLGVLKTRRGDGTYVTNLEPEELLSTMSLAVDFMQGRTLLELFEVRRLLEPAATAQAAARMGEEDLGRLRDALRRMDVAATVEELVEADDEFHGLISTSAGNATLAALLQNLSSRTVRARVWRGLAERGALERTRVSHRAIYQAICNRDPELARAAAVTHITEVETWFDSPPRQPGA